MFDVEHVAGVLAIGNGLVVLNFWLQAARVGTRRSTRIIGPIETISTACCGLDGFHLIHMVWHHAALLIIHH